MNDISEKDPPPADAAAPGLAPNIFIIENILIEFFRTFLPAPLAHCSNNIEKIGRYRVARLFEVARLCFAKKMKRGRRQYGGKVVDGTVSKGGEIQE